MRYNKQTSNNYIIAIGTGYGGTEITETEYNDIMAIIQSCPAAEGISEEQDISAEEALDILLGGVT